MQVIAGTLPQHLSVRLGGRESPEPAALPGIKAKKEKKRHKHKKDRKRRKHAEDRRRSFESDERASSPSPNRSPSPVPRRPTTRRDTPPRQASSSPEKPASPKAAAPVSQVLSAVLLHHEGCMLHCLGDCSIGKLCMRASLRQWHSECCVICHSQNLFKNDSHSDHSWCISQGPPTTHNNAARLRPNRPLFTMALTATTKGGKSKHSKKSKSKR